MASGRLGKVILDPYTSAEVYNNSSGSTASISINSQVIDQNTNSEISVSIAQTSVCLTGITTFATGASCYCRVDGFNLYNNCYYGAYSKPSNVGYSQIHQFTAADCTVTCACDSQCYGGSMNANPTIRYDSCYQGVSGRPATHILGFFNKNCQGQHSFITKCDAPSPEAAGQVFTNPLCGCGGQAYCSTGGLCENILSSTSVIYNYDQLNCAWCCCNSTCWNHPGITAISPQPGGITHYGLFSNSSCTFPLCRTCFTACSPGTGCSIQSLCCLPGWNCTNCWISNTSGCSMISYGVQRAAANCSVILGHYYTTTESRYIVGTMSANCWFTCCCVGTCMCYFSPIELIIDLPTNREFPIKYFAYSPSRKCTYMMVRSTDENYCGIFSFSDASVLTKKANSSSCCGCPICLTLSDTDMFRKVASYPEIMTCSYYTRPTQCVSCLFKFAETCWSLSIYNCSTSRWDTFVTNNLIDWELNSPQFRYSECDISQVVVSSDYSCVYRSCNCFMANADYSGMVDYKVSANNYERTGVVISNGDKVFVDNNSPKCMSVQVWGYEG